jgi:two-component system, chemotaxis family, CheB/CheR fusion protein
MIESTEYSSQLEGLLGDLFVEHGVDFGGYDRTGLARRVAQRMAVLGVGPIAEYRKRLAADPNELSTLLNGLLVHCTSFFRDPATWGWLATRVVPRLLHAARGRQLRIWSAGCATGEEAFSLGMLLAEAMGVHDYGQRVKIYATDRDPDVIARARRAEFTEGRLRGLPDRLRREHFVRRGDRFALKPTIRRAITFGRQEIVGDLPISRLHLIVCRNTLMYLDSATQAHVFARFAVALDDAGVLFLGGAEMPPLAHPRLFEPLSLRHHIFTKSAVVHRADQGGRPCSLARST